MSQCKRELPLGGLGVMYCTREADHDGEVHRFEFPLLEVEVREVEKHDLKIQVAVEEAKDVLLRVMSIRDSQPFHPHHVAEMRAVAILNDIDARRFCRQCKEEPAEVAGLCLECADREATARADATAWSLANE